MASLYVTEFPSLDFKHSGGTLPSLSGVVEQKVSFTGTPGKSDAFATNTHIIRVHTDGICSILIGADPTATTGSLRMIAGQTEYFVVSPGQKISAITNT